MEYHLFPDMPISHYQQIAPQVRERCERYGLPYNTGPLRKQWGFGARLAFPGGGPRPKPGPYVEPTEVKAEKRRQREAVPAFP